MGIKKKVFGYLPLEARVWLFERKLMDRPWPHWYKENYRTLLNEALNTFLSDEELGNNKLVRKLTFDIIKCWLQYEAMPYEYFLYDMRNSGDIKRATFLTDVFKDNTCTKLLDKKAFKKEIKDKYSFYQLMESFFGRKAFLVNSLVNEDAFVTFSVKTKSLFCKMVTGSRGKDAFAIDVPSAEAAKMLLSQLTENKEEEWIVEERIKQCREMAQWNGSSVNTVRIPSFLTKTGFKVLCPAFRTGRHGSMVDNAAQGGVVAGIDSKSGLLMTDGVDEKGNVYKNHPDSGFKFKGWQIPRWQELLKIAERAHRTIPHQKYIGWDFALTEEGWKLVEGNWGQMIGQYATKQGVKDLFLKYITEE